MSKKIFYLILFASFLWHGLFFSAAKIVVTPPEGHQSNFSKVSFLGAILDEGTLDIVGSKNYFSDEFNKKELVELVDSINLLKDEPAKLDGEIYEFKDYFESGNLDLKNILADSKADF